MLFSRRMHTFSTQDPRWESSAPGTVSHVAVMGGVKQALDGQMRMDPEAANNAFDLNSAEVVYSRLQAASSGQPPVTTEQQVESSK